MHCDCEFAGDSNSRALETEALPEFEALVAQVALGRTAGQNDQGRLIEKPPQVGISSAGYAPAIVNFPRLIAPGRQAKPGTHSAGVSEVFRVFNCGGEKCRGNCAYSRDRHQEPTGWALARTGKKQFCKFRRARANAVPSVQYRQHWLASRWRI
jgi:hypothetical protein